jgi:arylsulfatase A-like enzyme
MDRLAWFACGASPFAVASLVGLLRTLQSAGSARAWIARFAGGVAMLEIAIGAIVGAAFVTWLAPRDRRLAAASTSAGIGGALGALVLLADGLPPLPEASTVTAIGVALVVGIAVGGGRRLLGGAPEPARAMLVPAALVVAAAGSRFVMSAVDVSPGSVGGLAVIAGTVALAVVAATAAGRLSWIDRPALLACLALPAIAAGAVVTSGRPMESTLPPLPASGPPDVLVVVLDTLRADHVPAATDSPFPTPTLARLSREGVRLTSMTSTSCWTLPAHASLFTGLSPLAHGAGWERGGLREGIPTLAGRMRDAGWRTAGFSANPWVSRELGLDRGFETFVEADASRAPRPPWPVRFFPALFARAEGALLFEDKRGRQLTSELLRWLSRGDSRPAFAFVNLLEPHLPYDPPSRYHGALAADGWTLAELESIPQDRLEDLRPDRRRPAREIEGLRRLYAAEVAYADALLGRIVAALERAGRLDHTLIVVVSDHGENLGDHPPLDHQLGLWDSLVRIPALLRLPAAIAPGTVRRDTTSLEDVPGWVEGFAGLPQTFPGEPWNRSERPYTFAAYDRPQPILEQIRAALKLDPTPWDRRLYMLRDADRKWIFAGDGRHEAYDLVADPGETRNLAEGGAPPAAFRILEETLAHLLASRAGPAAPGEAPPLDDETLRRLRSLGYVP